MIRKTLPLSLPLLLLATTALLAEQKYVSSSVKYNDSSLSHAKGRSGDATLEARALLNADGTTDLGLTTGNFDGTAAQGTITRVQLKTGDSTSNFNDLDNGGILSLRLDEQLWRGAVLQVQANIRGVDANRTGVVTVEESVKLRPDLVAAAIGAPAEAVPDIPLLITAVIQERNGDIGARASCVLSVNGAEVDRADQMWVDASDSVTCQFVHTFATVGEQQLAVSVENVAPGDWDSANNSASATIVILNPEEAMTPWTVNATEEEWVRRRQVKNPAEETTTEEAGWHSLVHFRGHVKQADLDFEKLRFGYSEVSDGTVIAHDLDFPLISSSPAVGPKGRASKYFGMGVISAWIHSRGFHPDFPFNNGPNDFMSIQLTRAATRIVYHSAGRTRVSPNVGPDGWYYFDSGYDQSTGDKLSYGTSVDMRVLLYDENRTFEATPHVVLTPYQVRIDKPYTCRLNGRLCDGEFNSTDGKKGTASYNWNF